MYAVSQLIKQKSISHSYYRAAFNLSSNHIGSKSQKPENYASNSALDAISKMKLHNSKKIVRIAMLGNLTITAAKFGVWMYTGSSAMLSEAIHSLVDTGNQALLLIGLTGADNAPDKAHQYGYGKSVYFWSLVSALGTFWFGAGISMWNSARDLITPSLLLHSIGWETWTVLSLSFIIDGFVLSQTIRNVLMAKPPKISFLNYVKNIRDPTTAAVIMEDSAACVGVVIAVAGIAVTQFTHIPLFDSLAGMAISSLLAFMGIYLARLNQKFLLGQAVDPDIINGIKKILIARPAIDEVHSVQSQWIGPYAFAYKAEVDFDGTYLAARLIKRYKNEFSSGRALSVDEVKLLLAWYAEDVVRTVEREVKDVEAQIQKKYPEARYIELEPDSRKAESSAIDDGKEAYLKRIEMDTINQFESIFKQERLDEISKMGSAAWKDMKPEELAIETEMATELYEEDFDRSNIELNHHINIAESIGQEGVFDTPPPPPILSSDKEQDDGSSSSRNNHNRLAGDEIKKDRNL